MLLLHYWFVKSLQLILHINDKISLIYTDVFNPFGSRPSDHYFRSVCWLSVCLFVQFFSAVFDPISIKLGHMLYV